MEDQKTPLLENGDGNPYNPSFGALKTKEGEDGEVDIKTLRPRRRKITRKVTVEPLIVFTFMTYSASSPFLQQYVYHRFALDAGLEDSQDKSNDSQCYLNVNSTWYQLQQEVQATAATFSLSTQFCYITPALFTCLLFGAYSDKVGRKIGMVPALAACFFRLGVVSCTVYWDWPLWTFYPLVFIEGLMGSAMCILASSFAYISDITDHQTRSRHLLIVEICMGLGVTAAQIGMGHLISSLGFLWPVVILFIMQGLTLMYAVVGIPETIIKDPNARFFTLKHYKDIIRIYAVDDAHKRRWKLQLILLIYSLFSITELGLTEVQTLYFLNSPLCWSSILIGYFSGTAFLIKNISSMLLLALCFKRTGDLGLVMMGLLSYICYQLILPFATQTYIVFLAALAGFGSMLVAVMLRSFASKLIHPDEQGALFASQGWFMIFSAMVGAISFNSIYSATLYIAHGFVFFLGAGLSAIAFVMALILFLGTRRDRRHNVLLEQEVSTVDEISEPKS